MSDFSEDLLQNMLWDLYGRAAADPYFADIGLYVMRPSRTEESFAVIQTRVDEAINCLRLKNGKGGAAVTFLMPIGDTEKPNVDGPQMRFVFTARVQEHPILNWGPKGTKKSAEQIAIHVARLYHLCMLNGRNCLAADPATLTPSEQFSPKVTYDVRLFAQGNLARPQKVAMPLISPRGGAAPLEVTLSCATPGAAIYYTTDGSYPSSVAPTAQLYAAPLTVSKKTILRAAAELADHQQSDVAQAVFSDPTS